MDSSVKIDGERHRQRSQSITELVNKCYTLLKLEMFNMPRFGTQKKLSGIQQYSRKSMTHEEEENYYRKLTAPVMKIFGDMMNYRA